MAAAQTGRDTTIIVNQQRIVVTTHKGETHVAVYDSTDNQLLKTRETVFANQQEVERVYVTSPFLPRPIPGPLPWRPYSPQCGMPTHRPTAR